MSDLNFQNLSTVQSNQQLGTVTLPAATTIAPQSFLTVLTGTTNVAQITPPVTGVHMLALLFNNASPGQLVTTGNILVGSTTVAQNVPKLLVYNPLSAKYSLVG